MEMWEVRQDCFTSEEDESKWNKGNTTTNNGFSTTKLTSVLYKTEVNKNMVTIL